LNKDKYLYRDIFSPDIKNVTLVWNEEAKSTIWAHREIFIRK